MHQKPIEMRDDLPPELQEAMKRFRALLRQLPADREALATLMLRHGIPTGHGDTHADLLVELEAHLRQLPGVVPGQWHNGAPEKPWSEEWFIAETTYGDRVVLRALPDEYDYDFKTADDTYIKRDKLKRWMQFPDSAFISPTPAPAQPAMRVVPEGWKLVPVEPTHEMRLAAVRACEQVGIGPFDFDQGDAVQAWSAMINASPATDTEGGGE